MSIQKTIKFNPFDYPSCFDTPERLTDVDFWHEHIPFAFTLIEGIKPCTFVELGTHKGDSYCAFCQAVAKQKTETRCFAVDNWEGDEHVGLYEKSIYEELKAYHDPQYGSFSTLLKMSFDNALASFTDKSIDLLHIDGLHTYDAVRHDFETWLPKMSERGIVLFHDTNVREDSFAQRGYEVWRFFEEISSQYPSYEFKFGNGLGIIAVGTTIPDVLQPLLGSNKEQAALIEKFFFALGLKIHDISKTKNHLQEIENLNRYIDSITKDRDTVVIDRDAISKDREAIIKDREVTRRYVKEIEEDHKKLQDYYQLVEVDRKILTDQLSKLQADRNDLIRNTSKIEADRTTLLEYTKSVEEKYQEVEQSLKSLEKSKLVRLGKNISMLLDKKSPGKSNDQGK